VAPAWFVRSVEQIVLHVRDAYDAPATPVWKTDLAPFMKQYGNLYPVMSKGLFSLADPSVAKQHATLLAFAFERGIDDPNHMPVTRDLSSGKRQAVLRWLAQYLGEQPTAPAPTEAVGEDPPASTAAPALTDEVPELEAIPDRVVQQMLAEVGDGYDGKTNAMRGHLRSRLSHTGEGS
jgi:hypothetical protein